ITYLGRLDAEKHLHILIRAFADLVDEGLDAQLLMIGGGTDRDNRKRLASRLRINDKVVSTGRFDEEDKVQLHRIGTVFCMPSPAELQSIATLEAMASGQPVVAVDAGALKEICQDNRNGFLCRQDDHLQIADSIKKILTDSKLRE